ncbi:MAG TPA: heparan-alpha-glucosaminide N-acetyltransferase domain-containing protein [Melioribacteraceae bacterium]|nr:heparan-alpha-glucosaminide N-acetyltransferase domain-containing protein [Melioribacteraceae bacterium]
MILKLKIKTIMQLVNKYPEVRNEMADLLKGFAVIFMILVHSFEKFLNPIYFDDYTNKIVLLLGSIPAAPVFMIVMGYFLWFSKKSFKQLVFRSFSLIGLGLILNILLNLNLIIKVFAGKINTNIYHYIFGVDILFLAGLSIFILSVIKFSKTPKTIAIIVLLFQLILISLNIHLSPTYSFNDYFLSFIFKVTEWSYFPFIPWFVYPLFGFVWAQNKKLLKYFNPSLIWRIFLVSMFFLFIYYSFNYLLEISNNLSNYYNHNIRFVFYSFVFIAGYWLLLKQINYYLNTFIILRFIRYLGKNVTLIYIIQWIIIGNLSTELYGKLNIIYTFGLFLLVTAITSVAVYYLENKIKVINI